MSTPGAAALAGGCGARPVARDALRVEGPEALSYLQGQCSQDLEPVAVGGTIEALLLSPQGRVDTYVRITRTEDQAFVVDTDPGCGPAAVARLERFRLRTRVTVEPLDWTCLSLRGPEAIGVVPTAPGRLSLAVEWPGWSGVDLLGPVTPGDPDLVTWLPDGAVWCDEEEWEVARIEAGVPVGGREITPSTIAAEVGLVERTVSFTKGCFTGQELVARLDARGSNVARHLAGVVVAGSRPPVGSAVWTTDGTHQVGELTSAAWSPERQATVALALLHRRVTPPEVVEVRWGPDDRSERTEARATTLPIPAG